MERNAKDIHSLTVRAAHGVFKQANKERFVELKRAWILLNQLRPPPPHNGTEISQNSVRVGHDKRSRAMQTTGTDNAPAAGSRSTRRTWVTRSSFWPRRPGLPGPQMGGPP